LQVAQVSDPVSPVTGDDNDERVRRQTRRFFGALAFAGVMLGIVLVLVDPYTIGPLLERFRNEHRPPVNEHFVVLRIDDAQTVKTEQPTQLPWLNESNGKPSSDNVAASRFNTLGNNTASIAFTEPGLNSPNMSAQMELIGLPKTSRPGGSLVTWAGTDYLMENHWSVRGTNSSDIEVFAGALAGKTKPAQGVVAVKQLEGLMTDASLGPTEIIDTLWSPIRTGSLRIMSLNGHLLRLSSDDGTEFVFDLQARQWAGFLPHELSLKTITKGQTGRTTLLPLEPTKLRPATRGMILDYGTVDVQGIQAHILNQWYDIGRRQYVFQPEYGGIASGVRGDIPKPTERQATMDYVRAYAGHSLSNSSQGLLVVEEYSGQSIDPKVSFYSTPRKAGPVRIKEVAGSVITLEPGQSTGGLQSYFDLSSRRWVDSAPPSTTP
jgi:hypothetical protein